MGAGAEGAGAWSSLKEPFPLLDLPLGLLSHQVVPLLSMHARSMMRLASKEMKQAVDSSMSKGMRVQVDVFCLAVAQARSAPPPAPPEGSRVTRRAAAAAAAKAATEQHLDLDITHQQLDDARHALPSAATLLDAAPSISSLHLRCTDSKTYDDIPTRAPLLALLAPLQLHRLKRVALELPDYPSHLQRHNRIALQLGAADLAAIGSSCPALCQLSIFAPHLCLHTADEWAAAARHLPASLATLQLRLQGDRVAVFAQGLGSAAHLHPTTLSLTHEDPILSFGPEAAVFSAPHLAPICSRVTSLEVGPGARHVSSLLAVCGPSLSTWTCWNAVQEPLSALLPLLPDLRHLSLKQLWEHNFSTEEEALLPDMLHAISACTTLSRLTVGEMWTWANGMEGFPFLGVGPGLGPLWSPPAHLRLLELTGEVDEVQAVDLDRILGAASPQLLVHLQLPVCLDGCRPGAPLPHLRLALQQGRVGTRLSGSSAHVMAGTAILAGCSRRWECCRQLVSVMVGLGGEVVGRALHPWPHRQPLYVESQDLIRCMEGMETLLLDCTPGGWGGAVLCCGVGCGGMG